MIEPDGRPPEEQKLFTRRLAESLASEDGARAIAQLQLLGLTAAAPVASGAAAPAPKIGVWGATRTASGEIELVRDRAASESWRFWADVDRKSVV